MILLPQGSSALYTVDVPAFAECPEGITTSVAAFASVTVADFLSTAHVRTSHAPSARSQRSSLCVVPETRIRFPCSSAVEAFPVLPCPPRLDWLVPDLLRLTLPHPLFAQGTVARLTRLGRGLVADFAVVALAATHDVTVDSESSTQQAVQRVVLDPFTRSTSSKVQGHSLCLLTQALELTS